MTENLFGDILSDEAAALTGSLGMLPSATVGGKINLYEPIHGSAPDIAGKGIANPLGAIATAAMLLRHSFQREQEARAIEQAIAQVLAAGYRTADLKRGASERLIGTEEMGRLVLEAIGAGKVRSDARIVFTVSTGRLALSATEKKYRIQQRTAFREDARYGQESV